MRFKISVNRTINKFERSLYMYQKAYFSYKLAMITDDDLVGRKKSFWGERSISWKKNDENCRYSTVNPELFNSKWVKRKFKHHQAIIYYLIFNIKGLAPSINLFFCGKSGQACYHQVFQNDIKLFGDTIGTFFGNMSMY